MGLCCLKPCASTPPKEGSETENEKVQGPPDCGGNNFQRDCPASFCLYFLFFFSMFFSHFFNRFFFYLLVSPFFVHLFFFPFILLFFFFFCYTEINKCVEIEC